jgi:hypothetical protein
MEKSDTHTNDDDAAFVVNTDTTITPNKKTVFVNIWLFIIGAFVGSLAIATLLWIFPPSCMCPTVCPLNNILIP